MLDLKNVRIGLSEVETYLDFVKVCTFSTPRQALPVFHTLVRQRPSKIPQLLPDFNNNVTNNNNNSQ